MEISLRDLREDAADALDDALARFRPGAPREDLLAVAGEICLAHHTIGASMLLLEGQPQEYFLDLCRAAETWRRLLQHLRSRGLPPPPASASKPLLGAMAADHWPLAQGVARLSATAFQPGEEYEDDCDWAVLLAQTVAAGGDAAATAPYAERLLRSGPDTYAGRLAVLEAIRARDGRRFAEVFGLAALAAAEETERIVGMAAIPVTELAPYRWIWLEGLALLRLAARAGLAVPGERFAGCPPLARVPRTADYAGDGAIPLAGT